MTPSPISLAHAADLPRLFDVWHLSVRATHDFLADSDIAFLMPFVRDELARVTADHRLHVLRDANSVPYAFLCVEHAKIEMLFVHPDQRGSGAGRTLVQYAITALGATAVDVNEHNTQAHGFYRHLGFIGENRSECDPFGKPFPILHLKLAENG
ncbi:GNAT family N-acetyltransferase [Janthinobacterium agaricidamnosum]|uniref:GNAT family N-acetyltransferase n=1 Tax=Janthinobacterium agaricidamnosum TaxID=55508 RepID=A0A3G2E5B7_9BURK|nr:MULTISPECIES: GNAT family N-acetyltransferase [Janthinobacterium]AYM74930.1 GNAT family N-acetyltransferase [Janthinobacterium agaricidamnosum]OEZ94777.1 putative N-acetyltransferase YjaB [Janthinobacterium sp. HH107]